MSARYFPKRESNSSNFTNYVHNTGVVSPTHGRQGDGNSLAGSVQREEAMGCRSARTWDAGGNGVQEHAQAVVPKKSLAAAI